MDSSTVTLELESLIKNHLSSIDNLADEARKQKEMLDDILANDSVYQKHTEAAKEATRIKSVTKKEVLKRPDAKALDEKIRQMRASLKELKEALSDYLQEYARLSGTNEIKDDQGEAREIVYVATLSRKARF